LTTYALFLSLSLSIDCQGILTFDSAV